MSSNVEVVLDFLICYRVPSMLKPLVKQKKYPCIYIYIRVGHFFRNCFSLCTPPKLNMDTKNDGLEIFFYLLSNGAILGTRIYVALRGCINPYFFRGGILKGVWYVYIIYPIVSYQSRVVFFETYTWTHGA